MIGNVGLYIYREVSTDVAYIQSKRKGLAYLPLRGWQYGDAGGIWQDDDTLTITGKFISVI